MQWRIQIEIQLIFVWGYAYHSTCVIMNAYISKYLFLFFSVLIDSFIFVSTTQSLHNGININPLTFVKFLGYIYIHMNNISCDFLVIIYFLISNLNIWYVLVKYYFWKYVNWIYFFIQHKLLSTTETYLINKITPYNW